VREYSDIFPGGILKAARCIKNTPRGDKLLTLSYTPLKKPIIHLRVPHLPLENLYSAQGFYKDPPLAPLPFCFPAIFFQTVSHPRVLYLLNNFAIHSKGLG
jgi:hypothetical protein